MGMYDKVICEYPLPLEEFQDRTFQTKGLQCPCEMSLFRLEVDGTLSRKSFEGGWEFGFIPDEPFTFYDFVKSDGRYEKKRLG